LEQQKRDNLNIKIKLFQQSQHKLSHQETVACVDSELMLLWWDGYDLYKWQPNLLNFRVSEQDRTKKPPVLLASRLDGPSVAIAMRLVDDALEVEQKGLAGTAYVDARGIGWDKKGDSGYGYGGYDESLREMAALLKDQAKLAVVLDNKPELFKPQSCPGAALYCGWYSLAKYVDCCTFNKGAVAYHTPALRPCRCATPNPHCGVPSCSKPAWPRRLVPSRNRTRSASPSPPSFLASWLRASTRSRSVMARRFCSIAG
jgi:uncharacterized protein (TIGR03790 family)